MDTPLSFLLNEIVWKINGDADKMLKRDFDVSFKQFLMMVTLANTQPTTQHNLALCLDYTDAAVSRMVNKLATANYVLIQKDPTHLKKNIVTLNNKGLQIVIDASKLLETEFQKVLVDAGLNSLHMSAELSELNNKLKEKNNE